MIVGVPKEVKTEEYRVAMTPAGVDALTSAREQVLVEASAGEGSGIRDEEFAAAGAVIVADAHEVWAQAELIVKIKEPQPQEFPLLREGQTVFTYLHLAADKDKQLTGELLKSGCTAIAYETVEEDDGSLPLLKPMSEIAGRLSIIEGAKYLERSSRGSGVLLTGAPGVKPATVVVLGGGVVGTNAAWLAAQMKADVFILDIDVERLRYLDAIMPPNVKTLYSNRHNLLNTVRSADLLIGAVLVTGDASPILVKRADLKNMQPGSVFVDVSIDHGGCSETSRATTHKRPTYVKCGVVHFCVANMPGAVSQTSTYALTNVTFPFVYDLAVKGLEKAIQDSPSLSRGVNVFGRQIRHRGVANALGLDNEPLPNDLAPQSAAPSHSGAVVVPEGHSVSSQ